MTPEEFIQLPKNKIKERIENSWNDGAEIIQVIRKAIGNRRVFTAKDTAKDYTKVFDREIHKGILYSPINSAAGNEEEDVIRLQLCYGDILLVIDLKNGKVKGRIAKYKYNKEEQTFYVIW